MLTVCLKKTTSWNLNLKSFFYYFVIFQKLFTLFSGDLSFMTDLCDRSCDTFVQWVISSGTCGNAGSLGTMFICPLSSSFSLHLKASAEFSCKLQIPMKWQLCSYCSAVLAKYVTLLHHSVFLWRLESNWRETQKLLCRTNWMQIKCQVFSFWHIITACTPVLSNCTSHFF